MINSLQLKYSSNNIKSQLIHSLFPSYLVILPLCYFMPLLDMVTIQVKNTIRFVNTIYLSIHQIQLLCINSNLFIELQLDKHAILEINSQLIRSLFPSYLVILLPCYFMPLLDMVTIQDVIRTTCRDELKMVKLSVQISGQILTEIVDL